MLRELSTSIAPHIFAMQVHSVTEERISELLYAAEPKALSPTPPRVMIITSYSEKAHHLSM